MGRESQRLNPSSPVINIYSTLIARPPRPGVRRRFVYNSAADVAVCSPLTSSRLTPVSSGYCGEVCAKAGQPAPKTPSSSLSARLSSLPPVISYPVFFISLLTRTFCSSHSCRTLSPHYVVLISRYPASCLCLCFSLTRVCVCDGSFDLTP